MALIPPQPGAKPVEPKPDNYEALYVAYYIDLDSLEDPAYIIEVTTYFAKETRKALERKRDEIRHEKAKGGLIE